MMLEPLFSRAALILLWSALAVVGVSCSKEQKTAKISQNRTQQSSLIASPVVDSPSSALTSTKKPLSTENDKKAVEPSSFEMGLDKAAGGFSISQSARSPEDWELVADYYQDAIKLMKSVQPQSRYYPIAKVKVKEYQRHFDYASEKSVALGQPQPEPEPQRVVVTVPPIKETIARSQKMEVPDSVQKILQQNLQSQQAAVPQELPPPKPPQPAPAPRQAIPIPIEPKPVEPKEVYAAVPLPDSRQAMVFSVPIKRRIGGTPIIDVTFNGKRRFEMIVDTGASGTVITQQMASLLSVSTIGKAKANTASAQSVEFPIGYVDSIEAGGVKVKKVPVAIAGSELENGLLGHDFFGNYDITIKSDVVEFRPRSNTESQQKSKSIPIYPTKLFEE